MESNYKKESEMDFNSRKSVTNKLEDYCANSRDGEFIEVTEWTNGEGYDIAISRTYDYQSFNLTHGEVKALKELVKALRKKED